MKGPETVKVEDPREAHPHPKCNGTHKRKDIHVGL